MLNNRFEQRLVGLPEGSLRSLVYTSEAITRFYQDDLQQLLESARAHNASAGITGLLLYRSNQFIQFLEGPTAELSKLMESIESDPRHTNIRVVIDEWRLDRTFDEWTMGYRALPADPTAASPGFRDSFADLASSTDSVLNGRAAKELALWFRVRSGRRISRT